MRKLTNFDVEKNGKVNIIKLNPENRITPINKAK